MVRLAWRMVRQRPASVIATFLAQCIAVAVVTACGVMLESGVRFHGVIDHYAAAPVLVATTDIRTTDGTGEDRDIDGNPLAERGRVPAALTTKIAAADGVRAAIDDVAVPGRVIDGDTTAKVQAHPWSAAQLAPFALRSGAAPSARDQVALDQHLATSLGVRPGRAVRLGFADGIHTFTISGIVASTHIGDDMDGAAVFVGDAEARELSGSPGQVDVIGVLPDPGVSTDALAAAVRKVLPAEPESPAGSYPRVYVGSDRGDVETVGVAGAREFVIAVSAASGGTTLLIAILVIAGSVGLSVKQRHRDIALLRAIAATPRQVRRMVVRECVALGVLAGAVGIWPGLYGARRLRSQFVSHSLTPDSFREHLSWLPPTVAVAAALLVAVVAGWIASLRASRIRPTEALVETSVERSGPGVVRGVVGLLALGGAITLTIVAGNGSGAVAASVMVPAVFLFVIAVACWSALIIRAMTATFGRLLNGLGVTGRLATANAAASAQRLSAVVSSLVLAVALGGTMWFLPASETHTAAQQSRAGLVADYVVTSPSPGLPSDVAARIRRTTGVRAATGVVRSTMFSPKGGFSEFPTMGVDASTLPSTVDLDVTKGRLADLHGNTIAVDKLTAATLGLHVGSEFRGWFGDGAAGDLRVVAVYTRGLGFAQFTVPGDLLRGHTTTRMDDSVFVRVAAGHPQVVTALRAELARLAPGAALRSRSDYQAEVSHNFEQNTWTNQLIAAVLIGYVIIAAVNTLLMAGLARRREFAILRLAGTTRVQVLRMVRIEQILLFGLAMVLGTAIAAATLVPTVQSLTGSAVPYIPLSGWAAIVGGTVLLGIIGIVPVRRVLRTHEVEAIGVRE